MDLAVQANVAILPQDFIPSRAANSVRLVTAIQAAVPANIIVRFTRGAQIITTRLVASATNNLLLPPIVIPARPDVGLNFSLNIAGTILVAFLEESYLP